MKKQKIQRLMSFLLAICLLVGMIPCLETSAEAAEIFRPETVEVVTTEEELMENAIRAGPQQRPGSCYFGWEVHSSAG